MKKTKESFNVRFKNRIENMGKDGVIGIIKSANVPINKENFGLDNWAQIYKKCRDKNNFSYKISKSIL